LKALFEMMDGMDFMDDMDTEKTHLRGYVHSVHNVHSVHCLDKSNWFKLPNLAGDEVAGSPFEGIPVQS
jgi:hypothetical protein